MITSNMILHLNLFRQSLCTGDRVMLNSQLIITMPNRGRTYRFSPEDEFVVVRRKDESNFYVAFIKAPWLGVFELNDEGFSLCDED